MAKGLSQNELAVRAGCAQSMVSKIESGKVERSKYLLDLARELDVSASYLNSDEDKKVKEVRASYDVSEPTEQINYGHAAIDFIISAYESRALSEQRVNELAGIAAMYVDMGQGGLPPGKAPSQPQEWVGETDFTKQDTN